MTESKSAFDVMKNLDAIFSNDFEIDGKHYKWLTVDDIMGKEKPGCAVCHFHAIHTPCGEQLQKYASCVEKETKEKFDYKKNDSKQSSKLTKLTL